MMKSIFHMIVIYSNTFTPKFVEICKSITGKYKVCTTQFFYLFIIFETEKHLLFRCFLKFENRKNRKTLGLGSQCSESKNFQCWVTWCYFHAQHDIAKDFNAYFDMVCSIVIKYIAMEALVFHFCISDFFE